MLNTAGLDLASTPRFGVPMRFFMAAPPFALAAGLLIAAAPDPALASRWAPGVLAATHLLLLGFVSSIMCGSLLQLLPVLVGTAAVVGNRASVLLAAGLAVGTALLAGGFVGGNQALLLAGGGLLAASLGWFALRVIRVLLGARPTSHRRLVLLAAAAALGVTVMLGLMLVASRLGWIAPPADKPWTDVHLLWGLAGWMGLLLIGVASDLVPMFHLAPPPPDWLRNSLALALWGLLLCLPAGLLLSGAGKLFWLLSLAILLVVSSFAVTLFVVLYLRRKQRRDPTLGFWWLGQASVLVTCVAWLGDAPATVLGVLIIVGAGMSFTTGTLFKIVPFLSWYHLQSCKLRTGRRDVRLPTMRAFIGAGAARWQLALHSMAVLFLVLGAWQQIPLVGFGALLLAASAVLLWVTLWRAWWRYRSIARLLEPARTTATP